MPPGRTPALLPENQFPDQAIRESVQKKPPIETIPASMVYTWNIASAADAITPWGRNPALRDRQLRDFLPTESFLAGSMANVAYRNAAYDWEIRGTSPAVEKLLTDMLGSAIAGDSFGWSNFVMKFTQDLHGTDNGAFVELIRDPGKDANSRFKDERAPVLGIAHMDSNACTRTGNPEYPVIYTDREGKDHKLAWFEVIPFSDYPSAIEKMNGIGVCAVSRALRLAQIMRSELIFKDEKVSGRHYKQIHMVSGVSRQDIKDIMQRGQEEADNQGMIRYIDPAILASLDPEKPVSTATIDLASLPDGFDFDQEMKWYITGLALCFGVDYQEFAPLSSGAIGSSSQSAILNSKSSGKGPAMFMKIADAFANYGVLPRGYEMIFEDRDEQRELDKQTLRKLFQEEMALALRNGFLSPDAARQIGIQRGFYTETEMKDIPEGYGEDLLKPNKQNLGNTGGNTMTEDAGRTNSEPPQSNAGARLRKEKEIELEMQDRQDERRTLTQVFRDAALAFRQPVIAKERPVQPIVNVDVHNHPGKAPVIKFSPELNSTTRLIMPRPQQDNSMAEAVEKFADAISNQKQAQPPVVNVDVQPAQVTVKNEIKTDDQSADRKEFMKKVRKIANGQ